MQIVVPEWERVLVYRDGRFEEILGPGRHRRPRWRRRHVRVPIRPRLMLVRAQEVLTADGLAVKVSLIVAVSTADPRRRHGAVEDADGFVYAALQVALREAVARLTLDELLASRESLSDGVRERVRPGAEAVGRRSTAWRCGTSWCPRNSGGRRPRSRRRARRARPSWSGRGRRSRPPGRWPTPPG